MNQVISEVIKNYIELAKKKFDQNLKAVFLIGSHSRGDAVQDSDVDILIVLEKIDNYWQEQGVLCDLAYQVSFDAGIPVVISPILMDSYKYQNENSPFILNAKKDAKSLL